MSWLREHPYATVLAVVAIVFLVGAYFVNDRIGVSPDPSSTTAWGGSGGYLFPNLRPDEGTSTESEQALPNLYRDVQGNPPFVYSFPPLDTGEETGAESGLEFSTLIDMLSPKNTGSDAEPADNSLFENAYSFIPRGLITVLDPVPHYTPKQAALRDYGNEAGSYIKSFESRNQNEKMTRILKDQFEDPQNTEKAGALVDLADDLVDVGESLEQMVGVPEQARSANAQLAASYQAMGEKLALVPNAQRDEEKIAAMLAYNATVEEFIRNYLTLTTLFSLSEVTFRSDEPGSVFMFSPL